MLEEIFSFDEINSVVDILYFQVNQHKDKLNNEGILWIENFKNNFSAERVIGLKFISRIGELMKADPVVENNSLLQKRISDAATYFESKFAGYQQTLQNHPLITEHRETANVINENLNQLMLDLFTTNYYLQYCKQSFSVTSFLQHKLKFAQPRFNLSIYASGKKQSFTDISNVELYDNLKRWRDEVCDKTGMPIYMVANRATLAEISTYLPLNKKDLLQISGFGKAKVEKYGDEILQAVQDYCSANNIETNMRAKEANPKRKRKEKSTEVKTDTKTISYNLFKEGKTIPEIAKERNFAESTIQGHLVSFVGSGDIDIDKLVSVEKQLLIKTAAKSYGVSSNKILKDNLPDAISYSEIRLVLASEKAKN